MTTMKSRMEEIECDLNDKVSFFEVEEKIAVKVKALVDNIKDALLAISRTWQTHFMVYLTL
jgi:hypothetical protein